MAYVPGLTVSEGAIVRKKRTLPLAGEVLVNVGDEVSHDLIIARCTLPGDAFLVDVASKLDIPTEDTEHYTQVKEGDVLEEGQTLAMASSFFGMFKTSCTSPCAGTCEMISNATGKVLVRGEPRNVDIMAYIPGKIVEVDPTHGATVETPAVFIQGIFGIGGETSGEIVVVTNSPKEILTPELINETHAGKIIVGKYRVTSEAIKKAVEVGAKGIMAGSIRSKDLLNFMGYEIGVAITGTEDIGLTMILTEGFGDIEMSDKAFELFKQQNGNLASINGATQIRAGVIRPEAIIPREEFIQEDVMVVEDVMSSGLTIGSPIRMINEPYFGALGKVVGLPIHLQTVESGSKVRILEAELSDGRKVIVPRANVEMIS
jgi:hypothetical protein